MKKGWKRFWVVITLTFILGVILSVVGICLGAKTSISSNDFIYRNKFQDNEVALEDYLKDEKKDSTEYVVIENQLDIPDRPLEINLNVRKNASVKIISTTEEQIHYKKDAKVQIAVNEEGSEINVNIEGTGKSIENKIIIYLPENIQIQQLNIELDAGLVLVEGIKSNEYDFQVGAGKVSAKQLDGYDISAECGVGEIIMEGLFKGNVDIEAGIGDVELVDTSNESDYLLEIQAGIGEVDINGMEYSGIGNKVTLNENAKRSMKIECGIGTVRVSVGE